MIYSCSRRFVSFLEILLYYTLLVVPATALSSPNMSSGAISKKSRVVLVTGGNKGIGHAIYRKLLIEYPEAFVFLGARNKARGERAVAELSSLVPDGKDRISLVLIDTSSDESVQNAASNVEALLRDRGDERLYGIVNNAGVGWQGTTYEQIVGTNYFGPRRVNKAFAPFLRTIYPKGRIVNIASASGPMFVNQCEDIELKKILAEPLSSCTMEELDSIAANYKSKVGADALYGFSKALLNAYTALHAKECPELIINSCSPGYVKTDLAPQGTASSEQGAFCPVHLMMAKDFESSPTGCYYGSDAKRSPIDRYRAPGDPPFTGP